MFKEVEQLRTFGSFTLPSLIGMLFLSALVTGVGLSVLRDRLLIFVPKQSRKYYLKSTRERGREGGRREGRRREGRRREGRRREGERGGVR